jgi:hypothetical protein
MTNEQMIPNQTNGFADPVSVTTATNLAAPDLSNPQVDTNKYFNNFYAGDFSVGVNNDAIVAYFEQYTGDTQAGKNLAAAVQWTAQAQNLNPMAVLDEFQRLPRGQLNNYLAAFLNSNRVPTSLVGFKTTKSANSFVQRSILP